MNEKIREARNKVEYLEKEIQEILRLYATNSYDFYIESNQKGYIPPKTDMTEEMILNNKDLTVADKEQMLQLIGYPNDWETIHKTYCSLLKKLYLELEESKENLKNFEYYEQIDTIIKSINQ